MPMDSDEQIEAAQSAAIARRAIAKKVAQLAGHVSSEEDAEVIALLAEAYANLASEPPRIRS
jgi:hypothetical protein